MKIYEALENIKNNGPYVDVGICRNFYDEIDHLIGQEYKCLANNWEGFQKKAFKSWGGFSGNFTYPVEGSMLAYASGRFNHWDKETKYGALRWELLDHLIAWFKEKDI